MKTQTFNSIILSAISACVLFCGVANAKMYKWVDKDGNVFFSDQVPPDQLDYAREEINSQGVAVQRTDRAKTPAEYEAMRIEEERISAEKKAAEDLKKKADLMSRRFASESDIVRHRDAQLTQLKAIIGGIDATMESQQKHLDELMESAADKERQGNEVGEKLATIISDVRSQLGENAAFKKKKELEINDVLHQYEIDVADYRALVKNSNS